MRFSRSLEARVSIALATICALGGAAYAKPLQAGSAPSTSGAARTQYAYCWAALKATSGGPNLRYHSPIFMALPGEEADKTDEAAFGEVVARKYGGEIHVSSCSSRATAAEIVAVRDRRFAASEGDAVMTALLPPGAKVAPIEGASTPRTDPPGDGSVERPLVLECTATSGQFSSLTQRFETSSKVLVKIAGPAISIWKPSVSSWIEHPCVSDTRNGQFCSITPTRIWLRDSYELTPGAEESNELDIDRVSAGFKFETLMATPRVAPFIQARQAAGSCRPTTEPKPATAPAPPRTAF
jgi:hypothetical protein